MANAEEAVAGWPGPMRRSTRATRFPLPPLARHPARRPALRRLVIRRGDVADDILDNEAARVNVSLPAAFWPRLDAEAKADGKSRSGYIVEMTLRTRR